MGSCGQVPADHFIDQTAEAIGFDIEIRKKLRGKSILDTVRLAIRGVVPDDDHAVQQILEADVDHMGYVG